LASAPCHRDASFEVFLSGRYDSAYRGYWDAKKLLEQRKVREAFDRLNRAIAAVPDEPLFFLDRARCRLSSDDPAGMFDDLDEATRLGALAPGVWFMRSYILWQIAQYSKNAPLAAQARSIAATGLDRCIALDPINPYAYKLRSEIAASLGRTQESRDDAMHADRLLKPRTRYLDRCAGLVLPPR
jgi:tetratricopeptide (TPR) repeat protein